MYISIAHDYAPETSDGWGFKKRGEAREQGSADVERLSAYGTR